MRPVLGTTLVEMLLVLGLAALLMLGIASRPAYLASAARGIAGDVRSARAHAVAANVVSTCWTSWPTSLPLHVQVPPRGLLFTPDGLPRTCDGGGVGNTTILLEHRGRQAAVIVSSLGRVRWELR